jgi:hypothetical protein
MAVTVENALVHFGCKSVAPSALAKYMGFNKQELKLLNLYFSKDFNNSWIYISPQMITRDMGYSKLSNFYSRALRGKFKEGSDYKETDENNPAVKAYEAYCMCSPKSTYKVPHKRGSKQKYYLATGRTVKRIMAQARTAKSDEILTYFERVEDLALFQSSYISALHAKMTERQLQEAQAMLAEQKELMDRQAAMFAEQEAKAIEQAAMIAEREARAIEQEAGAAEREARAAEREEKMENLKQLIISRNTFTKNSIIYVVSSESMRRRFIFKVGSINSCTPKAIRKRLSEYNVGRPEWDQMEFNYIKKVYAAGPLDTLIRRLFTMFLGNRGNTELVALPFESLRQVMDQISDSNNCNYDTVNSAIENCVTYLEQDDPVPFVDIETLVGEGEDEDEDEDEDDDEDEQIEGAPPGDCRIPRAKWATDEGKAVIIKEIFQDYLRDLLDNDFDLEFDELEEPVTVYWSEFFALLVDHLGWPVSSIKRIPWRNQFRDVATEYCNLYTRIKGSPY